MASPSESPILPPSQAPLPPDLTDETQDFRFLSTLSTQTLSSTFSVPATLPRRGEKDFEPHGTQSQSSTLAASRNAMHDALSYTRSQASKSALTGVLDLESGLTRVERGRGSHARTMGKEGLRGWELLPEEALYLVERGNLEVRWRDMAGGGRQNPDEEDEGLPMSLQAAYALLVGALGLTVERFVVYAGLKRSGYVVLRGPAWYEGNEEADVVTPRQITKAHKGWKQWWSMLFESKTPEPLPMGPLIGNGCYRSYGDIYRLLSVIPCHDPTLPTPRETSYAEPEVSELNDTLDAAKDPPIRPCFYVWKPSTAFKKSAPGPPDFRVAVLDAREASFSTLQQLDELLQSVPYDPPSSMTARQPAARLKHGYRNVILAVVDQGVVSYVRVADAGFCAEKIYEKVSRGAGQKRGGARGRGSGKGRGRQG